MVKIKHINEETFEGTDIEFPDFQFEIANKIKTAIVSSLPIVPDKAGTKLFLMIEDLSIDRVKREIGHGKYKITVERIVL